jgi:steroid delta-isomerase-like uncharacterized protein
MRIREALFPDDLSAVRRLFEEYAAGLGIDLSFQGFAEELAGLPGRYARPAGAVWLADIDGTVAGCVAVRPRAKDRAEMKRLYVRPAFRGSGVGRALAEHVLAEAAEMGYRRVCLDTLPSMTGAIGLYRSLGFAEVEPYCYNAVPGALFLGRALAEQSAAPDGEPSFRVARYNLTPAAPADKRVRSAQQPEQAMTSNGGNVALIERYYANLWNQFDKSLIPVLLAEDLEFRGSLGQAKRGHGEFAEYMDFVRAAFPDFTNTIEEVVSEGDRSFARLTYRGTHRGELFGLPGSARQVEYAGAALFRFRSGRIAAVWVLGDVFGLLQQLRGVAPNQSLQM